MTYGMRNLVDGVAPDVLDVELLRLEVATSSGQREIPRLLRVVRLRIEPPEETAQQAATAIFRSGGGAVGCSSLR